MKTVIKSAALFGAVSLLAACGGEDNSDASVDQNYHDIKATLQGSVFNAIDGFPITDESLTITLVQGDKYTEAKVRTGDESFAGDYAIKNIPASTGANRTYRIVATADGFQPFETSLAVNVATFGNNVLQDKSANLLANMYMYPIGSFASDVKVNVSFNNEPVPNATVLLNPQTSANVPTADVSSLLPLSDGFQPALTAVTDANGVVTFSGKKLVLGGQYSIDVLPTTYEGSQLALPASTVVNIGTSSLVTNINLAETVPGNNNGLYVTSASNRDTDAVTPGGALTLSFSRAVSLVEEKAIGATLVSATSASLDATSVPDSTVTASLSADGKELTLTPNFAVGSAPVNFDGSNGTTADNGLLVNFNTVFVRIKDDNDSAAVYSVFALTAETGGLPSNSVQATVDF